MSLPQYNPGLEGISPSPGRATHKIVFRQVWHDTLAGPRQIDGSKSRDAGNTGDLDVLRPGVLMGLITSSKKYAPSILGVTTGAYTSGGTTLSVSAATAVELARRIGSSGTGTFKAVGPPSAAGTVAATAVTYSAVNTSTGAITVTSLGVNKIAGTFITPADGSETPVTLIDDGYGVKVTDISGNDITVPWVVPIAGVILAPQIVNWPSDTSLQAWIETNLNAHGQFVLDVNY